MILVVVSDAIASICVGADSIPGAQFRQPRAAVDSGSHELPLTGGLDRHGHHDPHSPTGFAAILIFFCGGRCSDSASDSDFGHPSFDVILLL